MEPTTTAPTHTDDRMRTIVGILDALTTDIGRLARRAEDGSSLAFLAERLAHQLELLDAIVSPTAHDIYIANFCASGDHNLSLDDALSSVDTRVRKLRARLGLDSDGHRKTSQPALLEAAAA